MRHPGRATPASNCCLEYLQCACGKIVEGVTPGLRGKTANAIMVADKERENGQKVNTHHRPRADSWNPTGYMMFHQSVLLCGCMQHTTSRVAQLYSLGFDANSTNVTEIHNDE